MTVRELTEYLEQFNDNLIVQFNLDRLRVSLMCQIDEAQSPTIAHELLIIELEQIG